MTRPILSGYLRDIGKLFPEEKRLGTKASDLVSGIALTACLDIDEAFDVLGMAISARYHDISRHVLGADISLYPVSSYLSKWIKPGAK